MMDFTFFVDQFKANRIDKHTCVHAFFKKEPQIVLVD